MSVLKFPTVSAELAITAEEIEEFRQLDATPPFDKQGAVGSAFEGERANAGALIDRMIRDHGLTWQEVLEMSTPAQAGSPPPSGAGPSSPPASPADESAMEWAERQRWSDEDVDRMHQYCCEHDGLYNDWELNFLESIGKWINDRRSLTPKQLKVLLRLVEKGSKV